MTAVAARRQLDFSASRVYIICGFPDMTTGDAASQWLGAKYIDFYVFVYSYSVTSYIAYSVRSVAEWI